MANRLVGETSPYLFKHAQNPVERYHHRTGDKEALSMVEHSLERMAKGGIYDQIGGGFHRYSVGARWQVPHFEKMLELSKQGYSLQLPSM